MGQGATRLAAETSERLPLVLMGAALASFAGIYVTAERFLGMAVLAVLLVATYATNWRLPANGRMGWMLRIAGVTMILAGTGVPKGDVHLWYMQPQFTNVIGILLSAELVLRAWRKVEAGRVVQRLGIVLFLSAVIITAASNTYDRQPMHTIIPVYALLLALSLRSIAKAGYFSQRQAAQRAKARRFIVLRAIALLLAMSLGFTVVFLLTRYDNRLSQWAMQFLRQDRMVKGSSIGLNSAPRLRRIFNPQPTMERVLQIDGTLDEQHLRVMVFDQYENRMWRPDIGQRTFSTAQGERLNTHQGGKRLRITHLSDAFEMLAVPAAASAVEAAGPLDVDELGTIRDNDAPHHPTYDVLVQKKEDVVALAAAPDLAQRARALLVPASIDAKVIELAKRVAGLGDAETRVNRIATYLRTHHQYSLEYDPGTDEPLNDFLLDDRAAHCQYFASAVVIMSRAVGVPARMATGYYVSERTGDQQMVVRDHDAHAWAECFIDGKGWLTVDATPASGRPDAVFAHGSKLRQWWEWFTDLPGRLRDWLGGLSRRTVLTCTGAIAAVVGVYWSMRFLRNRRRCGKVAADDYAAPNEALAAVGKRFEKWLKRQNISCAPGQTWREHLLSLSRQGAPAIDTAAGLRFVDAYDQARFGGAEQILAQISAALDQMERRPAQPGSEQHG